MDGRSWKWRELRCQSHRGPVAIISLRLREMTRDMHCVKEVRDEDDDGHQEVSTWNMLWSWYWWRRGRVTMLMLMFGKVMAVLTMMGVSLMNQNHPNDTQDNSNSWL